MVELEFKPLDLASKLLYFLLLFYFLLLCYGINSHELDSYTYILGNLGYFHDDSFLILSQRVNRIFHATKLC